MSLQSHRSFVLYHVKLYNRAARENSCITAYAFKPVMIFAYIWNKTREVYPNYLWIIHQLWQFVMMYTKAYTYKDMLHGTYLLSLSMHYMRLKSPASRLFNQPFIQAQIKLKKHWSSVALAFVRGIHRWPVNSRHKGPVTRKMFPFDDVNVDYAFAVTLW